MRDLPGGRKRERSWKDEVRERVRNRQGQRGEEPSLPLFEEGDPEAGSRIGDAGQDLDAADSAASEPARDADRFDAAAAYEPPELMIGEPPPLRAPIVPDAPIADLPLVAPDRVPTPEAVAVDADLSQRPAPPQALALDEEEPEAAEGQWSLGLAAAAESPRPVERPATFAERTQAGALDLLALSALWSVVIYFGSRAAQVPVQGLLAAWPYLVGYLAGLALVYAGFFTGTTGQTLGKMALGLHVVDAVGRPPGYARAVLRAALGCIGILLGGAAAVAMVLDPARRALHDRLFRTRVIRL